MDLATNLPCSDSPAFLWAKRGGHRDGRPDVLAQSAIAFGPSRPTKVTDCCLAAFCAVKRVIWLFMADAPSQIDLFDYKPKMQEMFDKDLPDSVRRGSVSPR